MASGPITSWQIDWETLETVIDFIFLGFPCGTADKESACNVGYVVSISGLGRSLFYSCSWTLGSPCLHKIQALWLRLASYGQECSLACFVIKVYHSLATPFAEGQIEELWQNCCIRGKAKVFPVWLLADQLLRTGALSTLLCAHLPGSCPHGFREFKGEMASVIRIW